MGEEQKSSTRGQFIPWALLHPPTPTRAFRFVYPILLVVSLSKAYLYDVRTGRLVQEINNIQSARPKLSGSFSSTNFYLRSRVPGIVSLTGVQTSFGHLNYVDHSPQHLFICGEGSLRVFSRQTSQCIYEISSTFGNYGCSRWKIGGYIDERSRSLNCMGGPVDADPFEAFDMADTALYRHEVVRDDDRSEPYADQIVAGAHHDFAPFYDTNIPDSPRLVLWEISHCIV